MRLIEKVDNNGQLLYCRFEPLQAIERNSTGWWDFKKHHADDGKTYYSYQEPDDNLLCSFRHISSVLVIDRKGKTGNILRQLSGADNDGSYAFHGQHYARYHKDKGTVTLFNNGNGTGRTQMLQFKFDNETGELIDTSVLLDDGYFAQACGALTFSGDNMIVGWGIPGDNDANNRLLTEYDATGTAIFSISLPTVKSNINSVLASYRSVKCK